MSETRLELRLLASQRSASSHVGGGIAINRGDAALFPTLAVADVGCLFLSASGMPTTPDPSSSENSNFWRHFGLLYSAWPRLVPP
jgi:hypothetical protein